MASKDFIIHKGLYYRSHDGEREKLPRWLGDYFASFYDRMMQKRVFPKMFGSDYQLHYAILRECYAPIHHTKILELGAGSGDACKVLSDSNEYHGVDISQRLLRIAHKRFAQAGFHEAKLYAMDAKALPFEDHSFDYVLCNLTFNFFDDVQRVVKEVARVMKPQGSFLCSVPVPDRNTRGSVIRGHLYRESELKALFEDQGFVFKPLMKTNGVLYYFEATKKETTCLKSEKKRSPKEY